MMMTEVLHGGEMSGDTFVTETTASTKTLRATGCRTWLAVLLLLMSAVQVAHSNMVTDAWIASEKENRAGLISCSVPYTKTYRTPGIANADSALSGTP